VRITGNGTATPQVDRLDLVWDQPYLILNDTTDYLGTMQSSPLYRYSGITAGGANSVKLQANKKGWITYNGVLNSGEALQIDVDKLIVSRINETTGAFIANVLGNISGDLTLLKLEPGMSVIEVSSEGTVTFTNLYVNTRARWY
jgi:hypothetical protein